MLPSLPPVEAWTAALAFSAQLKSHHFEVVLEATVEKAWGYTTPGHVLCDGEHAGNLRRSLELARQTGLTAKNTKLYLKEEAQGKGFGWAYFQHLRQAYRTLGAHNLVVVASDAGRLFWARDPIQFRNPDEPVRLLDGFTGPSAGQGPTAFKSHLCAARPDLVNGTEAFVEEVRSTPRAFSPARLYEYVQGRQLLGSAVSWEGIVLLNPWQPS